MDAKKTLNDLKKIPVIGDLIISFAIVVILTTVSSAGNFWGFAGEDKEIMINIFIAIGIMYFVSSIFKRVYNYTKKA